MSEPTPETLAAAMERARVEACGKLAERCVALPHSAASARSHPGSGGWVPLGRTTDRAGWRSWDAWWEAGSGDVGLEPRPT